MLIIRRPDLVVAVLALTITFGAAAAWSDAVTDALDAASAAYTEGKLSETAARLADANRALSGLQGAALLALMPPAPEGWTRAVDTGMMQDMVLVGGGSAIEATYSSADGQSFTLGFIADNTMILSMRGMFANEAMARTFGGKRTIGGAEFVPQDELTMFAILADRIMVEATGAPIAVMEPILAKIDYAALAAYGQ